MNLNSYSIASELLLDKLEKRAFPLGFNLYYDEYKKVLINIDYTFKNLPVFVSSLFNYQQTEAFYQTFYASIGLRMARFYYEFAERKLKQIQDIFLTRWETLFITYAKQVATHRVVTVQGTARENLKRVLIEIYTNEDLRFVGEKALSKIITAKIKELAGWQARRILRTEATNITGYATQVAALDIFPGEELNKQWVSSRFRTRPTHQRADGQIVPYHSTFSVGADRLRYAGDPQGSAKEIINCRCASVPIPINQ